MRKNLLFILLLLYTSITIGQTVTISSLLDELINKESITKYPNPEYSLKQFSSYDRASISPDKDGWFANLDHNNYIRIEQAEKVMFESKAPGAITRFWFTMGGGYNYTAILRFYIDGVKVLEGEPLSLIGNQGLVGYPLSASVSGTAVKEQRGNNLYLPIPYAKSCKITIQYAPSTYIYYNINYREYKPETIVESFKKEDLKKYKTQIDDVNNKLKTYERILPNGSLTDSKTGIVLQSGKTHQQSFGGEKAIYKISLKLSSNNLSQALRSTILKINFDGKESVWAPIGDFFGTGYKLSDYKSWYSEVSKDNILTCYWVMPFKESCTLTIENLSSEEVTIDKLDIITAKRPWEVNRDMHFGAGWFDNPNMKTWQVSTKGEQEPFDLNMITLKGKGVLVGSGVTVFNTQNNWWGEGDEKIYVDNESFPSNFGTGTEDYYGYAWCMPDKFYHPFVAQPDGSGDMTPGHVVNLRYRALDGIPFKESLKADIEIWNSIPTRISYAPISYYYLQYGTSNLSDNSEMARNKVALTANDVLFYNRPDKNGYIEFESMPFTKSGGATENQFLHQMNWHGDYQKWWRNTDDRQSLEFTFNLATGGNFRTKINVTVASDYSKYKVYINEIYRTTIDAYSPILTTKLIDLGYPNLLAGDNKIKFVHWSGKNNNMAGFDYLNVNTSEQGKDLVEEMYLVGEAAPCGWDVNNPTKMTPIAGRPGVFSWEGLMNIGEFKFIMNKGYWNPSVNAPRAQNVVSGDFFDLKVTNGSAEQGDYKFKITEELYYTVIVDTENWTMKATGSKMGIPLYVVGAATTVGWDNVKALKMTQSSKDEDVYTWTGHLDAAAFKFITKLGTWNSIVPNRVADENIVSGYKHEISKNNQGNYVFNILNAGDYTITVNLAENSMIVKNLQNDDPLYIVGSATPVGWDVNNPTEMTPIPGRPGVFSWEGMMNLGEFKFLTNKGRWNPSVNAPRAQNVVSGKSFDLKVTNGSAEQGDYKFKITDDMHYKVEVNTENWTMRATGSRAGIPLYVVGAATTVGWDNFKALKMTQSSKDEDVYTWTGHLDAAAFKFITKLGTWNSIVPNRVADENIVSGYKHEISKNNQGNYVFNILNAGDYTITVNLAENSMIVKKLQNNDPLYIVGSATPVGWDNFNALKMTQVGNLYTWEGMMNLGEFKFLTNKGHWNPSVNAPRAQNVVSGDFFDLKVTNGSAEQGDYKFKITEELYYTVIVDTENWTMKATGSKMGIPLYVVGAATTVGWDNFKALKMTQSSKDEDVYTWTGPLKEAQFKFITKLGTWNSIVPNRAKDESIINGYKHEISKNDQGNYVFNILNEGDYTITVNLADNSMIVKKLPKNEPIYLIGSATTAGWDNTKEISMNEVGEGIYSWRGYLKAEQFKFITKLGTWHSIIPNRAAHENIVKGYKHKISNNFQGDYKFNIIDAGTYTITVDLNEKTMLVNNYKMQNMSLSNTDAFTVVALQGSAMVRINSELKADRARLLDITGNVLDVVKDKTKVFYLGYNVPAGVYIVEMIHNNQVFTKKVLIK